MGMIFGGGGGGGMFRGPSGNEAGFGGIPPELQAAVEVLEADEPEPRKVAVRWAPSEKAWKGRFSIGSLLGTAKLAIFGIFLLVALETFGQQLGPKLFQYGIDHGVAQKDFGVVKNCAFLYLGAVAVAIAASAARIRWGGRVGETILYKLRVAIFTHLQRLGLDFYTREASGVVMTRMTSDVEALQVLFQEGLASLMVQILTLLIATGFLLSMSVKLTLIMLLGLVPILTVLTMWFRSASDRGYLLARNRVATLLGDLQENLTGMRVVTAYNRQKRNYARHRTLAGQYNDANIFTAKVISTYQPSTEALGIVAQAVLILIGGRMVTRGELSIGALFGFVAYLNSFFQPISMLSQLYNQYQQGRAGIIKLQELFDIDPTVLE